MKFLKFFILVVLVLLLSACEEKKSAETLKVGISPWPGYEPLALAADKNFFKTDIRIIRFSTPEDSYRALRDGVIDVAAFTADEVFHYAEVRNAPKIFLILDISNGADAIVAKKEINDISDLKGKRLGVEGSALGHYVINRSFDFSKNIKLDDITLKYVPIGKQSQAFKNDEVDAVVTYEPSKSLLIAQGAHVIFDSSQIPNEIVDVLVTNNETINTRSQDLKSLVDGWFRSLQYINDNKDLAMEELAIAEGTNKDDFIRSFSDIKIPSKEENIKMIGENGTLVKPLQRLSDLMYEKKSLDTKIDIAPILDHRILDVTSDSE